MRDTNPSLFRVFCQVVFPLSLFRPFSSRSLTPVSDPFSGPLFAGPSFQFFLFPSFFFFRSFAFYSFHTFRKPSFLSARTKPELNDEPNSTFNSLLSYLPSCFFVVEISPSLLRTSMSVFSVHHSIFFFFFMTPFFLLNYVILKSRDVNREPSDNSPLTLPPLRMRALNCGLSLSLLLTLAFLLRCRESRLFFPHCSVTNTIPRRPSLV